MRLTGIETEYGFVVEGRSPHTQFADSAALVAHCQENAFEGWDYAFESPRADLRGFVAEKLSFDPVDAAFDEAGSRDADGASQQGPCRRCTQRDDDLGSDDRDLLVEPPFALVDLVGIGPLVQAAFAARLVLEMLHGVGHE